MGRVTTGSTTSWYDFGRNGTGTYFYIYDSNGLNITEPLVWGTLCSLTKTIADSCNTQVLPTGGTYTLRVTGGLDYRRNEIQWRFCGITGTAQQTLVFNKYASTCLPIALYDSEEWCERNGFQVEASATVILKGIIGLYNEERDTPVVERAMKDMLSPSYTVSKISTVIQEESLHSTGTVEDVTLHMTLVFDSESNHVGVTELDGLHNFEIDLIKKLGYYDDAGLMPSFLTTAAQELLGDETSTGMNGAGFEQHVLNVQLMKATPNRKLFRDRVQTPDTAVKDKNNQGNSDKLLMDRSTLLEYEVLQGEAVLGYVALLVIVVGAILVGWRRSSRQGRSSAEPAIGRAEGADV